MNLPGKRRFRPRLWPALVTMVALVALVALGTWQVQRLHWKQDLIAERQARAQEPPMTVPATIVDPAALEFRPVKLTGRFRHDKEIYLSARTHRGVVGFAVVTPMVLEDGRTILVERGWVPAERRAPEARAEGQIEGLVTVMGVMRRGGWNGSRFFRPDNDPGANVWLWMDLPVMAAQAGLERTVTGLYVAAGPAQNPGGLPLGAQTRIAPRNDHLEYAITWYALALVLLVIYVLHETRRAEEGAADERL